MPDMFLGQPCQIPVGARRDLTTPVYSRFNAATHRYRLFFLRADCWRCGCGLGG